MHFHGVRYDLLAFVVMNDHVHVVVTPMDGRMLEEILYSWKSYTSHQLKLGSHREAPIWLDESFDRIVRDDDELEQKVNYILGNPWKRWPELQEYEWVGMTTESEG
jgi:putative DNA methylase